MQKNKWTEDVFWKRGRYCFYIQLTACDSELSSHLGA